MTPTVEGRVEIYLRRISEEEGRVRDLTSLIDMECMSLNRIRARSSELTSLRPAESQYVYARPVPEPIPEPVPDTAVTYSESTIVYTGATEKALRVARCCVHRQGVSRSLVFAAPWNVPLGFAMTPVSELDHSRTRHDKITLDPWRSWMRQDGP